MSDFALNPHYAADDVKQAQGDLNADLKKTENIDKTDLCHRQSKFARVPGRDRNGNDVRPRNSRRSDIDLICVVILVDLRDSDADPDDRGAGDDAHHARVQRRRSGH